MFIRVENTHIPAELQSHSIYDHSPDHRRLLRHASDFSSFATPITTRAAVKRRRGVTCSAQGSTHLPEYLLQLCFATMPSRTDHTFGRPCRLAPVSPPQAHGTLEGIPPLNAHFFYSSPIPLDDPLSTAIVVGAADSKTHKTPLRPFSPDDNNVLEKAWLALSSDSCRRNHAHARRHHSPSPSLSRENAAKLEAVIHKLAVKHRLKHEREGQDTALVTDLPAVLPDSPVPVCCSELLIDASAELRNEFCALVRKRERLLGQDRVVEGVMSRLQRLRPGAARTDEAATNTAPKVSVPVPHTYDDARHDSSRTASTVVPGPDPPLDALPSIDAAKVLPVRPAVHDDGISGMPFMRVGRENTPQTSSIGSVPRSSSAAGDRALPNIAESVDSQHGQTNEGDDTAYSGRRENTMIEESTDIPVGVSRLHKVALPVLQMKPIYWSPVNDISIVMRSTWFYK